MAGRSPGHLRFDGEGGWPCVSLRDAHISETAMKLHEIKCLLDGCERFPIVMARLVRPPIPAPAATDGPDEPGHDGEATGTAILTQMRTSRAMTGWQWPRRIDSKICACGRGTPGHDGGATAVPPFQPSRCRRCRLVNSALMAYRMAADVIAQVFRVGAGNDTEQHRAG